MDIAHIPLGVRNTLAPRNQAFSQEFRERCFLAWMAAGCPFQIKNVPFPEENGRRPSTHTVHQWMDFYDWQGRADEINARAVEVANTQIVMSKADILRKQFEDSVQIADRAKEYLLDSEAGFDSSASAVSAYYKATEEIRRSVGISELIERLSRMSDAEVEKEIMDRIRRAANANQFIEGEEVEDSETSEEESP